MGFFTDVNDIVRKNKLIENFLFNNGSIVTIVACGTKGDLKPLKAIYKDRENMEKSAYANEVAIKEQFVENEYTGTYEAVMSFVKKAR